VDDGFPDRLDQTRALGNAVVPQVAEVIGRVIVEMAKRTGLSNGDVRKETT
jgi:site-specific DNA-cytosine methylase